jgi:hypothetical protein
MSWARLLKRVFDIDIEHCPNCGGTLNTQDVRSTLNLVQTGIRLAKFHVIRQYNCRIV